MKVLKNSRCQVVGRITRFDERDNVQARYELEPDSPEWKEYYGMHPEWENRDREIQKLPGIGMVGRPWDLPMLMQEVGLALHYGRDDQVNSGLIAPLKQEINPERAAQKIKGFARHLGADLVRVGPLNPAHVYTHIGKAKYYPDRKRGEPIELNHGHAISLAMGINPDLVKTGPVLAEIVEVLRVYGRLAQISVMVAGYIRMLGYPARAHNLFNYQVLCIPLAIDAGMGELSRMGIMITRELGPSLKLAIVTTDLPLAHDSPVDIGVEEFCRDCKICAETCPSGAVPHGGPVVDRGVKKWKINAQACFTVWNETGTDCGVCIASCPWTKHRTPFHKLATEIASRKMKAGWWMSRAQKIVYGTFKPRPSPPWFERPDLSLLKKYKRLFHAKIEEGKY
jgi:ferredoxin